MKTLSLRRFSVEIDWGRVVMALAMVLGLGLLMAQPAYAQTGSSAFSAFQTTVTQQTASAIGVARTVLITGAVLSLIVGLAPMLWGQVKVKWIITALCACVLFGLSAIMVSAFSGSSPTAAEGQQGGSTAGG